MRKMESWGRKLGGIDLNTALLLLFAIPLLAWLSWSVLPAAVAEKTWLMEATSSGYKLNSFRTAVEQMHVQRPQNLAPEELERHLAPQLAMLEIPWRRVAGATVDDSINEMRIRTNSVPWAHSHGTRAVPLAAWPEDLFPGTIRHYVVAVPDNALQPEQCISARLPAGSSEKQRFMANARVRFIFSPHPSIPSTLGAAPAVPGVVISQAFVLGVVMRKVAIVDDEGREQAFACER